METPRSSLTTSRRRSIAGINVVHSLQRDQGPPLANSSPLFHASDRVLSCGGGSGSRVLSSGEKSSLYGFSTVADTETECDVFRDKFEAINKSIQLQQNQIDQAIAAIKHCKKKQFASGTLQELNARRLLLVAQQRHDCHTHALEELRENNKADGDTKQQQQLEHEDEIRIGSMEISLVVIHLNQSFSLKLTEPDVSYVFMILCRSGDQVYATQLANVLDLGAVRTKKVRFKELIFFDNLSNDFKVLLEVFALKIEKRPSFLSSLFSKLAKGFGFWKCHNVRTNSPENGPAAPSVPPTSGFQRCGYLYLNRETATKQMFYLNDAAYPLEGSIEIHSVTAFLPHSIDNEFTFVQ